MAQLCVTAVVTTYHRGGEMLQRSIQSVLQQTVPVMELLLVDDNGLGTAYQTRIAQEAAKFPQIRYLPMEEASPDDDH